MTKSRTAAQSLSNISQATLTSTRDDKRPVRFKSKTGAKSPLPVMFKSSNRHRESKTLYEGTFLKPKGGA